MQSARHLRPVPNPPQTLEALFREYYDQVYRTAYRITGNAVDAEDVLQTVFLRIMRKESLNLSPSPGSYLHRAAINASLDLIRSRSRSKSLSINDSGFEMIESPDLDPESEHVERELQHFIRETVAGLGQRSAQICVLRYFEGYTNQEIAGMMGTSQIVVGVVLHRSRARLRKQIRKFMEGHRETN